MNDLEKCLIEKCLNCSKPRCNNCLRDLDHRKPRPIRRIHPKTGEVVAEYPSIANAEKITGVSKTQIQRCLRKKTSLAGGYLWEYIEEEEASDDV